MFSVDRALVGNHIPCAVGALVRFLDHCVGLDCRAAHTGRLGVGVGCARRVEVTVEWVVKRADDAVEIGDGRDFRDFFRADDLGLKAHVAVLGPLGDEHVKAVLVIGKGDAADVVEAAGHARDCLKFFVKLDGVALQGRHVGVAVERVKPARGMPSGTRCQL